MSPYVPRAVRFLELWAAEGWRIKLYGIAHEHPLPRPELVTAARQVAKQVLQHIPGSLDHYHMGFLGVHDGRTSNFVFLDYWATENELHHHVFVSSMEEPEQLTEVTGSGLSACVWDLKLQSFERDAWVKHVLQRNEAPDFDAYLADVLNADV